MCLCEFDTDKKYQKVSGKFALTLSIIYAWTFQDFPILTFSVELSTGGYFTLTSKKR